MNDPLHLASSDHPGMMLTSTLFNGSNFLGWSRTIKMAFGAKLKLGFIDGSSPKPAVIHNDYQRWVCCDYMVTCWILNSMVAELFESFLYAQFASDLWKELEERYGQSNGPLIYHVERELIAAYFNKLKKFWDELHSLNGVPMCNYGKIRECTYGVTEKFFEIDSRSKLIQFLMRLNDDFKAVRTQILSMDPLPNLNKAYYIVQQVEKQKQVTHQTTDPTSFFAKVNQNVKKDSRNDGKNQGGEKKSCTFCNQDGHVQNGKIDLDQRMVADVCQEVMKKFKGKDSDQSNVASSSKPHADVWGPYKVPALNGAHYFFTIVDDFSRCTWTYLLHKKDQVLSVLCNFMAYIANHFNAKPKFLRSDNGTEIVNGDCLAYLRKQRIVHQKSIVYTPQQNSIVERKHRHLLDTARALKFHYGLPNKFWGDSVLTATYLINKMPMKILVWKTPFEMLHGEPPSYDHLRVMGCLCFATLTKPHKDKFAPRSIKSVLIGYPPGEKGYKLYNLETHERMKTLYLVLFLMYLLKMISQTLLLENDMSNISSETVMPNTPSDGSNSSIPNEMSSTRRSTRTTTQPVWLKDFVTSKHKVSSVVSDKDKQPVHPLFQEADFHNYPNDYSKHDYLLFVKAQGDLFTVALVYVDDILITGNSNKDITDTKLALDIKFTIKDLGLARYFLGIELCTTDNGTYLHQRKYVLDLLKDA
nr:hypothetical protein [Tanacetum cinerariifolium]